MSRDLRAVAWLALAAGVAFTLVSGDCVDIAGVSIVVAIALTIRLK